MKLFMSVSIVSVAVLVLVTGQVLASPFIAEGSKDIGVPGDPGIAGSWTQVDTVHTVVGGGSDWWDWGERAHVVYAQMPVGDWRIETTVSALDPSYDYWVKAGLFVRNDVDYGNPGDEREVNALMAALRSDRNQSALQYRPDGGNNWMGNIENWGPNPPVRLALQRRNVGGATRIEGFVSYDGSNWQYVGGVFMFNLVGQPYAGLAVTAHDNSRTATAVFTDPIITTPVVPPETPMRALAFTPPAGGMGYWGVREVWNAGGVGNLGEVVARLNDNYLNGTGVREDYQPTRINIHDSDSNGRFPWDSNFRVVDMGHVTKGSVDNISVVMSGTIEIPVADWYTFNVNSDDGFELAIDGNVVVEANYGKGASDVLGSVYLTAGHHPIRVLYWEGGGGSSVEVSAARGIKTGYDNTFALIGAPAMTYRVPGLSEVATEATRPGDYWPGNRDEALAAIQAGRTAGTNSYGTADRINHRDPESNGDPAGAFGGEVAFPNDVPGTDDNGFAFMATARLLIAAEDDYYLGYNSDDGAALRIAGQTWLEVVQSSHWGETRIEGDWLVTDAWTGWSYTVGKIHLAAGEYDLTFVSYEGSGGAYAEVFGSNAPGSYALLMTGSGQAVYFPEGLRLVPEPATLALLGLGAVVLVARRRRR